MARKPVKFRSDQGKNYCWRGEWAAHTNYHTDDLFTVAGQGLFTSLNDHTSDSSFDPERYHRLDQKSLSFSFDAEATVQALAADSPQTLRIGRHAMAKKLRRDKLREGLAHLGYTLRQDTRSSLWYEYSPGVNCRALFEGPHRILVGKRQAIRYTRSTIDQSHGLADNMVARILEAYAPCTTPP